MMETVETLLQRGVTAHRSGELTQAAELYREALDLDADNASASNGSTMPRSRICERRCV